MSFSLLGPSLWAANLPHLVAWPIPGPSNVAQKNMYHYPKMKSIASMGSAIRAFGDPGMSVSQLD